MKSLRVLDFAIVLALAMLVSEQGVLLHELGHDLEHMQAAADDHDDDHDHDHDGHHPPPHDCVKCFVFSQLSGSAPAAIAALATVTEAIRHIPFIAIPAPSRTVVAARSRAPPAIL